jgi:transposase
VTSSTESLTAADAMFVVRTLQTQLEALQTQLEAAHVRHARERDADRRQIERLVKMVEGLTQQLDVLLGEKAEERRAEVARLRAEAAAAKEAAKAGVSSAPEAAAGSPAECPASTEAAPGTSPDPGPPPENKPPPKRDEHGRAPKSSTVDRDGHVLRPDGCGKCGGKRLRDSGRTEPIEEWDYVRAHLRVRSTVRVGCTCEDCGAATPPPPPPPMPMDRASCTFALLAWICYSRCGMFIPLDRLLKEFAAAGVRIPSATATRWWTRGADLLRPIWDVLRQSLLADTHMRMDGTGLQVVFPRVKGAPKKGAAREGPIDERGFVPTREPLDGQIVVFGNDEHAVYLFTPTREGHHALDFLTVGQDEEGHPVRWKGTITADALTAQDCLFVGEGRKEGGCNAHGLRKFRDEADKAPLLASRAMAFIGRIYDIEKQARLVGLHGPALLAHRMQHAKPVVDEFRKWLDEHLTDLLPKNPIRKAMQYYINHWSALTLFLTDAEVPLDNNWSERALKLVALLRNNSLYAGGEDGAVRLCTLFSLIHTCRVIGIDPYDYLEWALTRIVPHRDNRGYAPTDLTPAAYKAALRPTSTGSASASGSPPTVADTS